MTGGKGVDTKRIEAAAESSGAKWIVRIVFGIAAVLAMNKLNTVDTAVANLDTQISDGLKELAEGQNRQDVKIAEMNGKIDTVNTKIDSSVLYQINDLKKRVERVEGAVRVP